MSHAVHPFFQIFPQIQKSRCSPSLQPLVRQRITKLSEKGKWNLPHYYVNKSLGVSQLGFSFFILIVYTPLRYL